MTSNPDSGQKTFGLLPEPERSTGSFIISMVLNATILALVLVLGVVAKTKLEKRQFEQTQLVLPEPPPPPPPPPPPVKIPPPTPDMPKPPEPPKVKLEEQKINVVKPALVPEPKPELKMEAKLTPMPAMKLARPSIVLAKQPAAVMLAKAAAPSLTPQKNPSTAIVHLGALAGVKPNPNSTSNAAVHVAAIGNPGGGMQGPAAAPRGVVGSSGLGGSTMKGGTQGVVGKVAQVGTFGGGGTAAHGPVGYPGGGQVGSAGLAMKTAALAPPVTTTQAPSRTTIELTYKPAPEYTAEARQMKVQGDVVLHVTFTARGQVIVIGVVKGLGHGLDEQAERIVKLYKFTPATQNGQPVDLTTNIHITFQLA